MTIHLTYLPTRSDREPSYKIWIRWLWAAGLVGLVVALCGCASPPVTVRYRVTIVIDDIGVQRTASGIWSFSLRRPGLALASPYSGRFTGSPIPIVLNGRGTMFLMPEGRLGGEAAAAGIPEAFGPTLATSATNRLKTLSEVAKRVGEKRILDCDYSKSAAAVMVTYRDRLAEGRCLALAFIDEPSSVPSYPRVDPTRIPGVRILRVEATIVE